jgi:hypothetical protein
MWLLRSVWSYFFTATGKFWRLAGKYPELAIVLLSEEPDVVLQPPKKEVPKDYLGPFWIMDNRGIKWKIYINGYKIHDVQRRIREQLLAVNHEQSR